MDQEPFENVLNSLHVFKCPSREISFSPGDLGTFHLIAYKGEKFKGEVATTFGDYAEPLATLFKGSPKLLRACVAMLSTWGSDDEDAIIAARDLAINAVAEATETKGVVA